MKNKKQKQINQLVFIFIIIFSCSFISFMGYMNFKTNHREIKDQIYQKIANEAIEGIENAIKFGKTLENYYGMNQIFLNIKEIIGQEIDLVVADLDGKILYCSIEEAAKLSQINTSMSDKAATMAISKIEDIENTEDSHVYSVLDRNYIIQPIKSEEGNLGLFLVTYEDSILDEQIADVRLTIILQTGVAIAVVLILYLLGNLAINSATMAAKRRKKLLGFLPVILILVAIIIQSTLSIFVYQDSYKGTMMSGGKQIMGNLNDTISKVMEKGIELDEVDGVVSYLTEKVEKMPILWNIKIVHAIANAADNTGRENELLINYDLNGETIKLEAELSTEYINDKMIQVILLMVSTLIIIVIFIIEITKLPGLILYCTSNKKDTECEESYRQVNGALRLTAFICSTAEYICVPYSAMIIREMNESAFGLSVGMTAALPLTIGGLAQMFGMFVLPKYIKNLDMKVVVIVFSIMMAGCNFMAFSSNTAVMIILFRGLAGVAYAGFKQVSNYLITKGYRNELQRSSNLSQDNAGLIGGVTCGAGLGAIISSTAGYSTTFIVSAFVFLIYMIITVYIVPWKWLLGIQKEEEEKGKLTLKQIGNIVFSFEMVRYISLVGLPLNLGVMLCVTLIPGICQNNNISTLVLSYCYIANGIAGIYIGPALANWAKRSFGLKRSIGFAFALTAVSIYCLELPLLAVMIIISGAVFGFIDGFATPLATDEFLEMKLIKKTVNESTALIFCVLLTYVFTTVAPIIAELMLIETSAISPLFIVAVAYGGAAFLLMASGKAKNILKEKEEKAV